jgi:hypothetical protein
MMVGKHNIQATLKTLRRERDALAKAIAALESLTGGDAPATATPTKGVRKFSAETRRRMAEAQRRRHALRRLRSESMAVPLVQQDAVTI